MKIIRPTPITDALLVSSSVAEDDYAEYDSGTTYAAGDRVISTTTHRVYESLQGTNSGHALPVSPEVATDWWQNVGATNRWKMFDGGVSVQTEDADTIEIVLIPGRADSIALLNIDAATYHITIDDAPGSPSTRVYDSGVQTLEEAQNIGDWYEYFFEPLPIRRSDLVLTDLTPYTSGLVTITLASLGGTVSVGELIVGLYRDLGIMKWEPHVGIVDYSVKELDPFGNVVVTERAFSKRMTADFKIDNRLVDYVIRVLAEFRATPAVWIGEETFTSTILYAFFKSFDVVITGPDGSWCNLELEGLI